MSKQLVFLVLAVVISAVLAFDCHADVPEFPDFDIEKVNSTDL